MENGLERLQGRPGTKYGPKVKRGRRVGMRKQTDSARLTTWMWGKGQNKEARISLVFWLGQLTTFNKTENTGQKRI